MRGDLLNGIFEFGAGVMLWGNVARIRRDQKVQGVYVPATVLFTAWGAWNLYFYPANGFLLSFIGGLLVVAANATWLYYAFKYGKGAK